MGYWRKWLHSGARDMRPVSNTLLVLKLMGVANVAWVPVIVLLVFSALLEAVEDLVAEREKKQSPVEET